MRRIELPRDTAYKAAALTAELHPKKIRLSKCERTTGLEPVSLPWQGRILDRCTTSAERMKEVPVSSTLLSYFVVSDERAQQDLNLHPPA